MSFLLFLIVNAILFLRPAELVPELLGLPLYQIAILTCIAISLMPLLSFLTASPLLGHPTYLLFVAQLPLAMIALFVNKDGTEAFNETFEYTKIVIYFTLFLALVTTPARLRAVTGVVVLCTMVTSLLGILHFKDVISLPALEMLGEEVRDPVTLEWVRLRRLRFTGMLQDPNEVAVFLSVLVFLCAYQWQNRGAGMMRHLWLVPLGVFLTSIGFTVSRGGLLALLLGTITFALYHFGARDAQSSLEIVRQGGAAGVTFTRRSGGGQGVRKMILFLAVMLPLALLAFAGRQTSFSASEGTGNSRIGLWSDWLDVFRSQPITGVGPSVSPLLLADEAKTTGVKHCAHNSFVQGFADLGFFGGLCFLGACLFAVITLHRFGFGATQILDAEQRRIHPYLMAGLIAYLAGMMTLVLNYMTTTAFVLGLPLTYYAMTPCYPGVRRPSLNANSLALLAAAGVGYLAFIYIIVRVFRNY